MMTDKQLKALMEWARAQARFEVVMEDEQATHRESVAQVAVRTKVVLYDAFGFVEGADGWPVVPQHPQTLPPAKRACKCSSQDVHDYGPCDENCFSLATSDPQGHKQAIADAAAEDRIAGLWALFNERWQGVPMTHRELAESLACLWPELKAIMEPNADMHASRDASLIESLIRRYRGIPDGVLERMAAGECPVGYNNPGPQTALDVLAARARLKA